MKRQGPRNEWITQSERTIHESAFMSIHELSCLSSEDARAMKFFAMRSRDWCNVIPVTEDGKIVLVRQYRIGIAQHTDEIPGGVADLSDSDIQATAIREMTEETGYVPLPGAKCETLGWVWANPAIQNNRTYSLVVGPVKKVHDQNLDPGEMIETFEVPICEIPAMIRDGRISHGLMLNTFFFLALRAPEAASALEGCLKVFAQAPA